MAINISDQFNVNLSLPIDSRMVVADSTARNNIQFKYNGLQVFDLSDRKTYVWNTSTSSWSPADVSGTGNVNSVPRWSSVSGLTTSCIIISPTVGDNTIGKVGINTTTSAIQGAFQINSTSSKPIVMSNAGTVNFISSNYYYSGSGDLSFDINSGSSAIKFRSNGEVWILGRQANSGTFTSDPLGVSDNTLNADGTLAIFVPDGDGFSGFIRFVKDLTFNKTGTGNGGAYIRSSSSYSTPALPDYTWFNDDDTGIYHPNANTIGLSINGSQRMILGSSGLLVSNGSVAGPFSRLHIDGGNATATFIQITNGTTTTVGSNTGFQIGINSSGYPVFASRLNNNPYLFTYTIGSSLYRFNMNQFDMYSNTSGESFATITGANGGGGSRVVRGTKLYFASESGLGTRTIDTLYVPSNCQVAIEATFVTSKDSPKQFVSKKIFAHYTVNSSGAIFAQNTGGGSATSGLSIAMLSSSSTSNISNSGSFDTSTSNQIKLITTMSSTSGGSGSSVVSYTAVINAIRGH